MQEEKAGEWPKQTIVYKDENPGNYAIWNLMLWDSGREYREPYQPRKGTIILPVKRSNGTTVTPYES